MVLPSALMPVTAGNAALVAAAAGPKASPSSVSDGCVRHSATSPPFPFPPVTSTATMPAAGRSIVACEPDGGDAVLLRSTLPAASSAVAVSLLPSPTTVTRTLDDAADQL